jgi:hypothetical protein
VFRLSRRHCLREEEEEEEEEGCNENIFSVEISSQFVAAILIYNNVQVSRTSIF